MIPISRPWLGEEEKSAVSQVLESGMLAQGPRVAEFERAFAEYAGVRHAIATSNGTTALEVALRAHGIGPGDEVITTPFTFIASINAILYTGATPRLIDVDENFLLDVRQLERAITPRSRAILPVHLFGQTCAMEPLMQLAEGAGLAVIEDACQAHGATYGGRKAGSFGTGCFSFYATKNMTTGEGGMVTTNDDAIAERTRVLINHGMKVRYHHDTLGYNYRMTDLAAAIGTVQLKRLDNFNARRVEAARVYDATLAGLPGLELPRVAPRNRHVYHQYTLRVRSPFRLTRDEFVAGLTERGIGTGIYYPIPAHRQQAVAGMEWAQVEMPVAEENARQVVSIPVHPLVSDADRARIASTIRELAGA